MKKHIVVFGAGKSAYSLIQYLIKQCAANDWRITVADTNLQAAQSKIGQASRAAARKIDIENSAQRSELIEEADLVISLLPPSLHVLVARECLAYRKHLLTASYLGEEIRAMEGEIIKYDLLFLCEMGLDPGIDHMSAMKLIDRIKENGGSILSFKSHCGGLVAPESDNNPWHYKISWNPRSVVMAGKAGAVFKEEKRTRVVPYEQLFKNCRDVHVAGIGRLAYYPNRDSMIYMPVYGLEDAVTFMRTTLRFNAYCLGWDAVVSAGLTNDQTPVNGEPLSFREWSRTIAPFINEKNIAQLQFLGLFDDLPIPKTLKTSADILQYLLETRLMMDQHDRDMIVMLHQIEYLLDDKKQRMESVLIVPGDNSASTAMAKTVGLPLGIAATLILKGAITLRGLHIPVLPQIYEPVLKGLEDEGITFREIAG